MNRERQVLEYSGTYREKWEAFACSKQNINAEVEHPIPITPDDPHNENDEQNGRTYHKKTQLQNKELLSSNIRYCPTVKSC